MSDLLNFLGDLLSGLTAGRSAKSRLRRWIERGLLLGVVGMIVVVSVRMLG